MVDKNSKEFKLWKEKHPKSGFEEHYGSSFLYYEKYNGHKVLIDNIAIKDFGDTNFLSWTENFGDTTELSIVEINKSKPGRSLFFKWEIPCDGLCFFWINKWTEASLNIILKDEDTSYALKVRLEKNPFQTYIDFCELSPMLVIKRNWIIGYKFYTDTHVNIFDLKSFTRKEKLSDKEAFERNIIPTENGENDEVLE